MLLQDATEENLAIGNVYMVLGSRRSKVIIDRLHVSRYSDALIWVQKGETTYRFADGSSFVAVPGTLFYLAKGSRYWMETHSETFRFIFVDFDFQHPDGESFPSCLFEISKPEEMENLFLQMEQVWLRKRKGYRLESQALVYTVLARVLQQKEWQYLPPENRRVVERVMQQITERYMEPDLTIAALAEENGVSDAYFRKLFREMYQISPVRYLTSIRVRQAKHLLEYQEQSVTEIAELCGYANVYYFSRVFHRETGMTPTEYSRKHGSKE